MWSKTRKAMEERLAPSLKGRVFYDFEYCRPHYCTEPPATSKCHCEFCSYHLFFRIVIDKQEKVMIANSGVYYKSKCYPTDEEKRRKGPFEVADVTEAMHLYLNVYSIRECLNGENSLTYLFAVLNRRIGKRTVLKLYRDMEKEPQWIQRFIRLRAEAEGVLVLGSNPE